MTHNSHKSKDFKDSKDTSATRILLIIREICNGKDINTLALNDFDFNVSKRTFQRDIKKVKDFFIEHFAYIPIASIAVDSATHTNAPKGGGIHFLKNMI